MAITCCFIKEQYFIDNAHFPKMLDSGNTGKQSHRVHLCIQIVADSSTFYLPLRNNLGAMFGNSVVLGIPFQLRIDRKLELTTDMHLS